jgi:hypothetical protein
MDARPLSSRAPEDPALIEPLKKEVTLSFDDAVRRVEAIVKEGGFSVLLTKSVDEILVQKLGLPAYPRSPPSPRNPTPGARPPRCERAEDPPRSSMHLFHNLDLPSGPWVTRNRIDRGRRDEAGNLRVL